jgi:ABC-2 type transport system ATP-binding protein
MAAADYRSAQATQDDAPKSIDSAVRLSRVKKKFGAKVAVDDLTLRIARGSVFGLIGPNGAGKTTTFSMLAGYLKPTFGEIEVLGYPPHHVDALRSRIGVLPQDAVLPPSDRVGELLVHLGRMQGMSRSRAHDQAVEVLAEVEGKDWWGVRCGALSHGMAKRVQLAQALLGNPDLVLLDEPTAGLDPRVAYEVRQLIKARKGRCTLVISSHNLHELEEMCDAAAILDHGRLVFGGSIHELTAQAEEVHVEIAPGPPLPLEALRAIPIVTAVAFDEERRDLSVTFARERADAETVIAHVLTVLLQHQVRISGVSKGRGLEQRVMELTQ